MKKSQKVQKTRKRKNYARKMRNEPNRKKRGLLYQINAIQREKEKLQTELSVKKTELQRIHRLKTQYRDTQIREANDRWEYHQLRLTQL